MKPLACVCVLLITQIACVICSAEEVSPEIAISHLSFTPFTLGRFRYKFTGLSSGTSGSSFVIYDRFSQKKLSTRIGEVIGAWTIISFAPDRSELLLYDPKAGQKVTLILNPDPNAITYARFKTPKVEITVKVNSAFICEGHQFRLIELTDKHAILQCLENQNKFTINKQLDQ